jgi:hypothetical protein
MGIMKFERAYYPVQTKDRQLVHIMHDDYCGTGSTPTGFLAPRKKTLCGLVATRNMQDVFTVADVSCLECSRRYQVPSLFLRGTR